MWSISVRAEASAGWLSREPKRREPVRLAGVFGVGLRFWA